MSASRQRELEHVGGIGLDMLGNVFDGTMSNSWMHGNAGGGARFANSANGGEISSVAWLQGGFRKNGVAGLILDNGAHDMSVEAAYFVDKFGPGIGATNGIASVHASGVENNQGAGVVFRTYGNFISNTFWTGGSQKFGISGTMAQPVTLMGNMSED